MKVKSNENIPEFKSLLRKLYLAAHPDLLRSDHPELSNVNNSSMQKLNGILNTIKSPNSFPTAGCEEIPFYIKLNGEFRRIDLLLQTAGGDCRNQLASAFEIFFARAGISAGKFSWGDEYFPCS